MFPNHLYIRSSILIIFTLSTFLSARKTYSEYELVSQGNGELTVHLDIAYDKEYHTMFRSDRKRIDSFWEAQVQDLQLYFSTLKETRIFFKILMPPKWESLIQGDRQHKETNTPEAVFNRYLNTDTVQNTLCQRYFRVTLLLLGTEGADTHYYDKTTCCSTYVVVVRWEYMNTFRLASIFAHLLQGSRKQVVSFDSVWAADPSLTRSGGYYFSNFTDYQIREHLYLEKPCLDLKRAVVSFPYTAKHTFTFDDQCRIKFGYHSFELNLGADRCHKTACESYITTKKPFEVMNPIFGTTCGNHKICMRGECVPQGYAFIHRDIPGTNDYIGCNPVLSSSQCDAIVVPDAYPLSQQITFLSNGNAEVSITIPGSTLHETKCLTIRDKTDEVIFETCESKKSTKFSWYLIRTPADTSELYICYANNMKCISKPPDDIERSTLTLSSNINEFAKWSVSGEPELPSEYYTTMRYIRVVVEVAVVCDFECSQLFNFTQEKIHNYCKLLLADAQADLQFADIFTYVQLKVTFLYYAKDLPFVKRARSNTGDTNITQLATEFGRWIYKQKKYIPKYDVALLLTGSSGIDSRKFATPASACQEKQGEDFFLGAIVLRVGYFDKEWCNELGEAFSITLSTDLENCLTNVDCDKKRSLLANCYGSRIREYVESTAASCLDYTIQPTATEFVIDINNLVNVPVMEDQCRFLEQNSAVFTYKNEETCKETVCYVQKDTYAMQARKLYPMNYTPCGINQVCYGGMCTLKGQQLKHVFSGKCLSRRKLSIKNITLDNAVMMNCSPVVNPFQRFSLFDSGGNGSVVSMPIFSSTGTQTCHFCLIFQENKVVLANTSINSSRCEKWDLRYVEEESNRFMLFHPIAEKYLKVDENLALVFVSDIFGTDETFIWSFFDTPHEIEQQIDHAQFSVEFRVAILAALVLGTVVIVAVVFRVFYKKTKKNRPRQRRLRQNYYAGNVKSINLNEDMGNQIHLLPFDTRWEFPRDRLKMGEQIGTGAFGMVYKATAVGIFGNNGLTTVAVKTGRTNRDVLSLELKTLSQLGTHVNVVNLLGACTTYNPNKLESVLVILEYCKYGSLKNYLRQHRMKFVNQISDFSEENAASERFRQNESSFQTLCTQSSKSNTATLGEVNGDTHNDLELTHPDYKGDYEVAKGMEYLSSKRILHGDLAARNVLLAEDHTVKICDFGLSKQLRKSYCYNYKMNMEIPALLPFKWMALESITLGLFSTESDIWSFGVVLWEIFSLGEMPYYDIPVSNNFVFRLTNLLEASHRLQKPAFCPSKIYDTMIKCWSVNPRSRPSFAALAESIGQMTKGARLQEYFQIQSDYQSMRENDPRVKQNQLNHYLMYQQALPDNDGNAVENTVYLRQDAENDPGVFPRYGEGNEEKDMEEREPLCSSSVNNQTVTFAKGSSN